MMFGWCVAVSVCCLGGVWGVSWRYEGCLVVSGGCQVVSGGVF